MIRQQLPQRAAAAVFTDSRAGDAENDMMMNVKNVPYSNMVNGEVINHRGAGLIIRPIIIRSPRYISIVLRAVRDLVLALLAMKSIK